MSKKKLDASIMTLPEVEAASASKQRFSTGVDELDRVLGSDDGQFGMVAGAVMLIGGEPGIGKSTLLTQVALELAAERGGGESKTSKKPIMYVCGEESPSQINVRINRILSKRTNTKNSKKEGFSAEKLVFVTATQVETIVAAVEKLNPQLVIVDSIQTVTSGSLTGAAGSVGQVRECAHQLTSVAKKMSVPMFIVGHVTKDGEFAGPKVLEHIVDSVLELSGERTGEVRMLRAIKNRFGATDEVGVFQSTDAGFMSVANPSALFLENHIKPVPGSATVAVVEGTRPLLIEVQALATKSFLAMPRRVGRGVVLSRIQVLSAVLQKHCKLPLESHDIFVSVVGGFTVKEPALDLGIAMALASSVHNKPLPEKTVFIGEVGLLGEIRRVSFLERRIKEAKRLGYTNIISKESHASVLEVLKQLGVG
ncbi:MAG: DNA repair protein RadA [Pseudomonadales bacterium]|nr:DNA repair protein RadA [Pseudomonadales bacterium]